MVLALWVVVSDARLGLIDQMTKSHSRVEGLQRGPTEGKAQLPRGCDFIYRPPKAGPPGEHRGPAPWAVLLKNALREKI